MTTKPFPTIARGGHHVRVTVQRNEPLYAIIELCRDCEPEITHIVSRRLAIAYKADADRLRTFQRLGVRFKIVPIRWCLADGIDPPKTLAEAYGFPS